MKNSQESFKTLLKIPNDRTGALKRDTVGVFFNILLVANIKKIWRGPFGDIEEFSKKNKK